MHTVQENQHLASDPHTGAGQSTAGAERALGARGGSVSTQGRGGCVWLETTAGRQSGLTVKGCRRMEQGQSRHSRPLAAQSVVPFGTSDGEVFKKMIKIVVPTKRKRFR